MAIRFLAWVAGWSVALWALLAAATVLLDPLQLRTPAAGIAARGRLTCAPMEAWKMPAFARSGARTVVMGTSRVALGMDATAAGPLGASAPTFNLGLPAATTDELVRLAVELMARGSVDSIYLSLDYSMFLGDRQDPGRGLVEQSGASTGKISFAPGGWPSRAEMRQVLNVACVPYEFDPRTGTVWWHESSETAFDKALHLYRAKYARCTGSACAADYRASLDAVRMLIRQAARTNTRLVIFVNPLPWPHLEAIRQAGAGPQFERWKRDLAAIVQEEGGPRVPPVRDFAVFAPETRANRPAAPSASESIAGFLDVSHYTIGLGRIMQRHLASPSGDTLFGAPLRIETIGQHLERDRATREAWASRPSK